MNKSSLSKKGFTLLELLIVVAILAATAFVVTGSYKGVINKVNDGVVLTEMQQIATAVQRFKQDTGYYPKTGPFALNTDGGLVLASSVPSASWFYSPANFYQLISHTSPLDGTGHTLETWNVETGRGWNGPYLLGHNDGALNIGDDINDGTAHGDEAGSPFLGTSISALQAIADPFEQKVFWKDGNLFFGWKTTAGIPREQYGSPYLLFGLTNEVLLVSMGPDGENYTDDDIKLRIN